jgi:hypothetical protein
MLRFQSEGEKFRDKGTAVWRAAGEPYDLR